jgi:vancomycin resistance protein YoaR
MEMTNTGARETYRPMVRRTRGARVALHAFIALTALPASLAVAVFLALVLYQIVFFDRVFIGVRSLGVDLSGMTRSQAITALTTQAESYLNFPVTLRYQDQVWVTTTRQAGAVLDIPRMVAASYGVGRSGSLLENLRHQMQALVVGMDAGIAVYYDTGPANVLLTQIAQSIDRTARDAQLVIQPDLNVVAVPAQVGLTVDVDATRALMHLRALARDLKPADLVVRETQPTVTEVESARRLAEALLEAPLTIALVGGNGVIAARVVSQSELAAMMKVEEEFGPDGAGRLRISFAMNRWLDYLNRLAGEVLRPAVDARFQVDLSTGALSVLQPSQTGLTLDVAQALTLVSNLLVQPGHRLEIRVTETPPAVAMERMNELGFTAVVAEATSTFKGSAEARARNIQVAAAKFHGLVVPPGAVFSFNEHLGPVTAENGFEDSLIIWGDRTAVGIGGGVCQVSSTAFRAAFFGGFDVVERWAHGYRVSWYEIDTGPGLDATIYAPDVDFKFRNDTDHFLLIQTYTDMEAGTLTFRFYGTPTGRQVTMEGPIVENITAPGPPQYQEDPSLPRDTRKQVEWARDGADVTVRRTVTQDGVPIHQDTFVSRYRPWRAMYLIGTGGGAAASEGTSG